MSIELSPRLTAYYFLSTLLLVVARILCFELFAYYLGPGNFGFAIVAAVCHVLLMSFLHIVFSDSLAQCRVVIQYTENLWKVFFVTVLDLAKILNTFWSRQIPKQRSLSTCKITTLK